MTRFSPTMMKSSRKYSWVVVASLALLASGCSRMGKARPDTQVAADVKSWIEADAGVPDKQLTINASNGVVTLSGTVSSDAARNAAASDAAQVEGVKTVVNNLQVAPAVAAESANAEPPVQPETSYKPSARHDERRLSPRKPARATVRASAPEDGGSGEYDPGVTVTTAENRAEASNAGRSGESQETSAQEPPPPPLTPASAPVQLVTVPAGTTLAIHLNEQLSSETAQLGDVFHGSIATAVSVDGRVVIPTSADVEGRVVDVKPAGRFKGQSELAIEITRIMMNGRSYSVATDRWSKAGLARGKATARKVGGGAAIGAVLGGIFGGGRGAAIGAAAGAGAGTGVAGAGKGQEIVLRPETVLDFQLQNPVSVVPGVSRPSLGSKE